MVHELTRVQRYFTDTIDEAENLMKIAKESPIGVLKGIGIQKKEKRVKEEEEIQIIEYFIVSISYEVEKISNILL